MNLRDIGFHFSAFFFILLPFASCKQQQTSPVTAIVSKAGTQAFTMVPIRQDVPALNLDQNPGTAVFVQEGLRLTYGIVECTGKNAAIATNILEGMARKNVESIRRIGRRILVSDAQQAVPVLGCKLVGEYLMGAGGLASIFGDSSAAGSAHKQTVWLAARGQGNLGNGSFSHAFYTFLGEILGASSLSSESRSDAITHLDATYNPCNKSYQAKKDAYGSPLFGCRDDRNYVVHGDYQRTLDSLLTEIAKAESAFIDVLAKSNKVAAQAYSNAVKAVATIQDGFSELPSDKPANFDLVFTQATKSLNLDGVHRNFRVKFLDRRMPVYSVSNPLRHAPPTTRTRASSPSGLSLTKPDSASSSQNQDATVDEFGNQWEWNKNFGGHILTQASDMPASLDKLSGSSRGIEDFQRAHALGTPAEIRRLIKDGKTLGNMEEVLQHFPEGQDWSKDTWTKNNNCASIAAGVCSRLSQLGINSGMVHVTANGIAYKKDKDGQRVIENDAFVPLYETDAKGRPIKDKYGQPKHKLEPKPHAVNYIEIGQGRYGFYDAQTGFYSAGEDGQGFKTVGEALNSSFGTNLSENYNVVEGYRLQTQDKMPVRPYKGQQTAFWRDTVNGKPVIRDGRAGQFYNDFGPPGVEPYGEMRQDYYDKLLGRRKINF